VWGREQKKKLKKGQANLRVP